MPINTRHIRTLILILGVMVLFSVGPAWADEAVATVNDEEISQTEFLAALKSRYGYLVLQTMIEASAVRQEAAKRNITVSPEEIDARYRETRQQIVSRVSTNRPPEEVFAAWLAQRHINAAIFRERIALQMMLERMVADQAKVTDDEVRQYYETHPQELSRPEAMKVSHICVTTEEKAAEIRKEIMEGRISFAEAANKHSIDPYGRDNGGKLPWMGRGELPNPAWAPIRDEAFKLQQDGELSPVFETVMGYEILRREAYQEPGMPPFEEIRDELAEHIHMAKLLQAADEMRRAIKRTAQIEQFIQFPEPGESSSATAGD